MSLRKAVPALSPSSCPSSLCSVGAPGGPRRRRYVRSRSAARSASRAPTTRRWQHFEQRQGRRPAVRSGSLTPSGNIYCARQGARTAQRAARSTRASIKDPDVCSGNPVSKYVGRIEFHGGRATPVCNTDTIRQPGAQVLDVRRHRARQERRVHLPQRDHRRDLHQPQRDRGVLPAPRRVRHLQRRLTRRRRWSSTASLIARATAAGSARSSSTTTFMWDSNRGGTPNVSGCSASSRSRCGEPRPDHDRGRVEPADDEPVVDVPGRPGLGALPLDALVGEREPVDVFEVHVRQRA